MDTLPYEIIKMILPWNVRMSCSDKNTIANLRLVCKAFDKALKPYVFKTIVLEFGKFVRTGGPDISALDGVGRFCNAIYLDMMVVRDEDEILRLSEVFRGITKKIPEMEMLIQALRQYCLNEDTFDETDFNRVIDRTLEVAPQLSRLRINLPFQVVGRTSTTATLLLANVLASVAKRDEESTPMKYLVIDHLSDSTLSNIWNNPQDMKYTSKVFSGLRHLILSIKRQETHQGTFTKQLWFIINKAIHLESLCIIGWNARRNSETRIRRHFASLTEWAMKSLPYVPNKLLGLKHLRCLELKRVDMEPEHLLDLVEQNSTSLKELYLNEVYLKVNSTSQGPLTPLWIGLPGIVSDPDLCLVAESLQKMEGLNLTILRVSSLGYDDFSPDVQSLHPNYDLIDPSGLDISFDKRFVEAVMSTPVTELEPPLEGEPLGDLSTDLALITNNPTDPQQPQNLPATSPTSDGSQRIHTPLSTYNVEAFQDTHYNSTSHFKKCIDGHFVNHNERALQELQRIISVADHGMALISEEISRSGEASFVTSAGAE